MRQQAGQRFEDMINRVQIKNFKCYGKQGVDFSLKRINFIFGDNSAGKSTFLQLLRMVFNGETEELDASFPEWVFKGDITRTIKMRVTAIGANGQTENHLVQSATIVESCPVYQYEKSQSQTCPLDCIGVFSKQGEDAGERKLTRDEDVCSLMRKLIHGYVPHVIHVEASRPAWVGESSDEAKKSSLNRTFIGTGGIEYVNEFFKQLKVPYKFGVKGGRLYDETFGVEVSRRNVGAGIDGLLEVAQKLYEWRTYAETPSKTVLQTAGLKESAFKPGHALLALEEPESHVNERQISPFMDFLFREANAQTNGQLVVECHSELMALKLKNFVRAGVVSPEDVAVLFAEKTPDGTVMHEIEMDRRGNFRTKWPNGGFFSERTKVIDEFFNARRPG